MERTQALPYRILSTLIFATGTLLLVFLHLYRLAEIPGLHFDEAWAMNYSWRIATESGFWPLKAMSPYTAPWAHYWAALWMKSLGPSLFVFRLSQVALSLSGLAFLAFSLPRSARLAFPFAVLLLPGLVLNHRFAIELSGLHVLAFGTMCWGLSRRYWVLAALAALVGTTAHILFYGVALGLLLAVLTGHGSKLDEKRARCAFISYFAVMALFFMYVWSAIPEKAKAAALVFSALAAIEVIWISAKSPEWLLTWWIKWVGRILPVVSAAFVFNALFFAQGTWTSTIYTGWDLWEQLRSPLTPYPLILLALIFVFALSLRKTPSLIRIWILSGSFFLGLMMLKPAPRYFELAMLGFAACIALSAKDLVAGAYHRVKARKGMRKAGLLLGLILLGLALVENPSMSVTVLGLGSVNGIVESDLRYLFFKDSSRDFLDKQGLVKFLGSSGCKFSDIETHDPRLLESLKALSLGDWDVLKKSACTYSYVARKTEEGASGDLVGEFLVRRK